MGRKSEPTGFEQVYILGLDVDGNPRGARFTMLKDSIVSAAMDMNCRVLIGQPAPVSTLAMRLPVGRVIGSGKLVNLFIPPIGRTLYRAILDAAQIATQQELAAGTTARTIH
jgi:hypothetical protein